MDDSKLFAKNDNDLEGMLQALKQLSNDIGMTFGLDKCAKASFKRGKLTKSTSLEPDRITIIGDLDQDEFYKYLGVNEGDGIQYSHMKETTWKECSFHFHFIHFILLRRVALQQKLVFKSCCWSL